MKYARRLLGTQEELDTYYFNITTLEPIGVFVNVRLKDTDSLLDLGIENEQIGEQNPVITKQHHTNQTRI